MKLVYKNIIILLGQGVYLSSERTNQARSVWETYWYWYSSVLVVPARSPHFLPQAGKHSLPHFADDLWAGHEAPRAVRLTPQSPWQASHS